MSFFIRFCFIFCAANAVVFAGLNRRTSDDSTLEILRIEVEDLQYALKSAQVEWNLLDERMRKQENSLTTLKKKEEATSPLTGQLAAFEKKISQLEKLVDKVTADLKNLHTYSSQIQAKLQALEIEVGSHEKKLGEVLKLKSTLTSISKAMGKNPSPEATPPVVYCVKEGDSLEKISRRHQISVEKLKKINHLSSDTILIGQELKIYDDTP